MKKLLLLVFATMLLAVPTNAKKPQLARSVWFLFEKQENMEKQPNDSVTVSYKIVSESIYRNDKKYPDFYPQPKIVITIRNKTERPVYVDLQKSFIVINEELYPLYLPTSDVQTQSNTSMVGVNLGLVGIGSAGTTSTAKITHAERFVQIPGETKKSIDVRLTKWEKSFTLNNVDGRFEYKPAGWNGEKNPNAISYSFECHDLIQYFVNAGEAKTYEFDDNPLTLDMRICYSFNDNMTPNFVNRSVYYTKYAVGTERSKGGLLDVPHERESAIKTCPVVNDYLNSPNKLYFRIWTPYTMPKK